MRLRDDKKASRILVTGGAGFIGSNLIPKLLASNSHVYAIDNLMLGREENLNHIRSERFNFEIMDCNNEAKIDALFHAGKFDTVFHLAANSDIARSIEEPDTDYFNTLNSTYKILTAMKKYGVKKIIFSSSSAVFGETKEKIGEDYGPMRPVSHYGAAKLGSEGFIHSFSYCYGIKSWIVRFPNVVGPRSTHGVIYDFIKKLANNPQELKVLGNGKQLKPYLHVSDLIDAMLFIIERASESINYFNISSSDKITVREIAKLVIDEMGLKNVRVVYAGGSQGWVGDVATFEYSTRKLHALGWKPRYSSRESVQLAIKEIMEEIK